MENKRNKAISSEFVQLSDFLARFYFIFNPYALIYNPNYDMRLGPTSQQKMVALGGRYHI